MTESSVRCGNPDCPEKPEMADQGDVPYEQRTPCPVCGGRQRAFAVVVHDRAGGTDGVGSGSGVTVWRGHAEGRAGVSIAADGVVDAPKLMLTGLGIEVTHAIQVYLADLTDGPDSACLIEIQDMDGRVLVAGVGNTAADAVASVFEHMLPPTSSEYLPPDDDMPDHDK